MAFSLEVEMEINGKIDEIPSTPHPVVPGVSIKPLISSKEHNLNITCMLVMCRLVTWFPNTLHQEQDDILFPLQGKLHVG